MGISKYKVLTFDCYGTLVDWESEILFYLSELVKKSDIELSKEEIFKLFLEIETDIITKNPNILYQKALEHVYKFLADSLKISIRHQEAEAFGKSIRHWRLFYDTQESLRFLSKNHKFVILSNIDNESIQETVTQIESEFIGIYTAQDIGSYKPNINNFLFLKKKLESEGFATDEILHVSVSLYHDIEPASKVGIDTCWINRANTANGTLAEPPNLNALVTPKYKYNSLRELVSSYE